MRIERILITVLVICAFIASLFVTTFDDSTYFHLRQVEQIHKTGFPFFQENYSLQKFNILGVPLYDYLLALFAYIPYGTNILSSILFGATLFLIYQITYDWTKSQTASLLVIFASAITPAIIQFFIGSSNKIALVLPLYLILIKQYNSLEIKNLPNIIILTVLLSFIHPISLLFSFVLLIYYFILKIAGKKIQKLQSEILIFTLSFTLWSQFILYKKAIMLNGFFVLWKNIPTLLVSDYFTELSFDVILLALGPIIVIGAIAALLKFNPKDNFMVLITSHTIVILVSGLWRILPWRIALALLLIGFAPLLGKTLSTIFEFLKKTKFANHRAIPIIIIGVLILVSGTTSFEVIAQKSQINNSIIKLIKDLPRNSVIWVHPLEANSIIYKTKHRVVQTSYFLLRKESNEQYTNYRSLIETRSTIRALELVKNKKITHILVTPLALKDVGINKPGLLQNKDCFKLLIEKNNNYLFKITCSIEDK